MTIIPIQTSRVSLHPKQSLLDFIITSVSSRKERIQEKDILVLSSKIVSYFEGNVIALSSVKVSSAAKKMGKAMNADPALVQLALHESDEVLAVTPWVLLTKKNGVFSANAGVDLSNVPKGYAVLWPKKPFETAQAIQTALQKQFRKKNIAVLIIDSFCIPGRKGTIACAIGFSGIGGYQDLKGQRDLYENTLRYSAVNIVDSLATAANVVMGESNEQTPLALIRGFEFDAKKNPDEQEMVVSKGDEMYPF